MAFLLNTFHWFHITILPILVIFHVWVWWRRGPWIPRYLHAIAFAGMLAGIGMNLALPPATNPDPMVRIVAPLVFPFFFSAPIYLFALPFVEVLRIEKLRRTTKVRITGTPPGEAPVEIRQAWIGLVLPTTKDHAGPVHVSEPRGLFWLVWGLVTLGAGAGDVHFVVAVDDALTILEKACPRAAMWWRQNHSDSLGRGHVFLFASRICEAIPAS